ncbi:MAG: HAMP domain-containing protein [Planctomycetes bacterium]|nr:HAMP domain-containing protein [Planctomycetota bacterium]
MRKSIKGQLVLLFILLSLTPIAVIFVIYSPSMLKDLKVQVTQWLSTNSKSQVRLITLWLRGRLRETELLATSPQFISCLKSSRGTLQRAPINLPEARPTTHETSPHATGLYLFDKEGELRAFVGEEAEAVFPHLDKEILNETLQGSPSLHYLPTGVDHSLFISIPVSVPETKEAIGALVAEIDLHQTKGILEGISLPGTHSFLVDGNGGVLACLTPGPGGKDTLQRAPAGPLTEGIKACLQGKKEGYSPCVYTNHLGQKVLGTWGWVPELGVGVIVEADVQEVFRPVSAMRGRLWWLLLIIGIGVTIVAVFTGRKLSEPLVTLASTARKIARGHLEERANVRSPNEIGELAQCINQMADSLQEKNAQLARINEKPAKDGQ